MRKTRKLLRFIRPYWLWAVLAPLLMMLEVAMDLLQPRLIERIIDEGIARGDMDLVVSTGLLMVVLAIIGLVGGMGCTVFAILAGQYFGADVRAALFRKIESLSFGNLDRLQTGALITRLTNDVTQVQEMVVLLLRMMVRAPLLLIGGVLLAVLTSPSLALLFAALLPVLTVALVLIINKTYPMFGEVQRRLDALNTVMQENLAGVRVVKAFARAGHEIGRFRRANTALTSQNTLAVRVSSISTPFMMLALNAGVVAALLIGGGQVQTGELQVGQLVAFINYLTQSLLSLMTVSMLIVRLSRAEASALRIDEVLISESDVQDKPGAIREWAPLGRVAFENVSFGYSSDSGDPVLKNVSFVAEPGETVAILGATGSGKSSLVNLIPRFYDVSAGRITVDGSDIRVLEQNALRDDIGVSLQEAVLFSGTIRDNIRYSQPDASEEEVIAVARLAQAHDFISRFPDGYDTIVGQRGVNLSGGQKQRIAIARALLKKPRLLILDDSTSAVDVDTEARIWAALAETGQQQTRFVVAQRISSVLGADKILVLDDGRIAAEGKHADLLRSSPIYREIYESQMESGALAHGGE